MFRLQASEVLLLLLVLHAAQDRGSVSRNDPKPGQEIEETMQDNNIVVPSRHAQPTRIQLLVVFAQHDGSDLRDVLLGQGQAVALAQPLLKAAQLLAVVRQRLRRLFLRGELVQETLDQVCHGAPPLSAR